MQFLKTSHHSAKPEDQNGTHKQHFDLIVTNRPHFGFSQLLSLLGWSLISSTKLQSICMKVLTNKLPNHHNHNLPPKIVSNLIHGNFTATAKPQQNTLRRIAANLQIPKPPISRPLRSLPFLFSCSYALSFTTFFSSASSM